jgi:hypothetical protein
VESPKCLADKAQVAALLHQPESAGTSWDVG